MDQEEYSTDSDEERLEDAKVGDKQDVTRDGGIKKECLVEGTGFEHPRKGAKVTVHYVGTLESDGSVFDSSRDRGTPFIFTIGEGQVIKGWDLGVATMLKGEKSILTCTSEYAYGAHGSPPKIPGGATLKFEVELLEWESREDVSPDNDGSIMKCTLEEKTARDEKPEYESKVVLDISGPGFDKKGFEVVIGDEMLPPGIETCVESMRDGEVARVDIHQKHLPDGDWGKLGLTDGQEATYNIALKSVERAKSKWSLKGQEKLEVAEEAKAAGNELYKQQKLRRAEAKYQKALDILNDEYGCEDELKAAMKKLKLPVLTNLAAVQLAGKDFKGCIEHCTKALEVDGSSVKALLRRAKAFLGEGSWGECRADLNRILDEDGLDPNNVEAKQEMEKLKRRVKAQDEKDKRAFGGLFNRMAKMEANEKRAAAAAEADLSTKKAAEGTEAPLGS